MVLYVWSKMPQARFQLLECGRLEEIFAQVLILTLKRPIGLPPHAPVAQIIADHSSLIRQKIGAFFI